MPRFCAKSAEIGADRRSIRRGQDVALPGGPVPRLFPLATFSPPQGGLGGGPAGPRPARSEQGPPRPTAAARRERRAGRRTGGRAAARPGQGRRRTPRPTAPTPRRPPAATASAGGRRPDARRAQKHPPPHHASAAPPAPRTRLNNKSCFARLRPQGATAQQHLFCSTSPPEGAAPQGTAAEKNRAATARRQAPPAGLDPAAETC